MKKFTVIVAVLLCFAMMFALCGCQQGFLSQTQTNSLYKTYGRPEAELTLSYKKGSNNYQVKIVYSLLMDKTPIAVTNFINLVNSGAYDGSIVDAYRSGYNYLIMGRYTYDSQADKYYDNVLADEFVGEFKSNAFAEPKTEGGYSEFSMFSLAMYHEESNDDKYFNSADGTIVLATSTSTLNSNNYAVFAEMKSLTYSVNDKELYTNVTKVPTDVHSQLTSFSSSSRSNVYESKDSDNKRSETMLSTIVSLNVKMSDASIDWSKLPKVGK